MPYKSEKIDISNTIYDRRVKLSQSDKQEVMDLYHKGYSQRQLGDMFGVSRSLIAIIVNPERAEAVKKRTKEHWRDYHPDKEEWAKVQREHRQYKHNLYINKKIGVK